MFSSLSLLRSLFLCLVAGGVWLAAEQPAQAQMFQVQALLAEPLLAQSGMAKTLVGYVLVFLALLLALLVVCRPNSRKLPEGDEKKR